MRVLHLDTGRQMRGGQHQVLMLLRLLRAAGHEPVLLAAAGSPLQSAAQAEAFETGWIHWAAVRTCSRSVDIVHCHDARAHTLAALWSSRPFVVSRRVGFPVNRGVLSSWKYARAAGFLAVSRFAAGVLTNAGVSPERVAIVPDAVELPAHGSDLSGGAIALASEDPGKGNALLKGTGLPIRLTSNLALELTSARVFAYASKMEGLGSAALLAQAYGVPVVASRVGGLCEAIIAGETGFLVDNQPAEFAVALTRFLEDPELARRFGAAGQAHVARHYSPELMLERTLAAYNQVFA